MARIALIELEQAAPEVKEIFEQNSTVAKKIIDVHGAKIEVANRAGGGGAIVTMLFPCGTGAT